MAEIKSEFFLALNQVATERGISIDDVLESIKSAVLAAYKKDYGGEDEADEGGEDEADEGGEDEADEGGEDDDGMEVEIDKNTGETKILKEGEDITPPGFGRIAAQTARQVILQKIREAEKKTIIKYYAAQIGAVTKGRVIRFDGRDVHLDIGKAEATLPFEGQIKNESCQLNDNFIVYIKEIREDKFGNQRIIVSRTDPKLIEALFKKEVPEIGNDTVKIKNVVRSPGERAKIAVYSDQSGVDPVGACVGQKGIRVKAVTDEIGGDEKIDIIQFNPDEVTYIREALSPASVSSVELDEEEKYAKVLVDEGQAPLAIGKNGVNVNLASKLTGYELDIVQIEGEEKEEEEKKKKKDKQEEEEKKKTTQKSTKKAAKESSEEKKEEK